ncbi:MAG TPA: ArsC family reductase [Rhizomicrobium sp.]|nr:ArsC family reductase [Rhizomicrobium sp.]
MAVLGGAVGGCGDRGLCLSLAVCGQIAPGKDAVTTVYGIKNCDTMKRARAWLEGRKVAHQFHDYKVTGIDKATLEGWAKKVGWEVLLNRAGTTFKKLPEADKENLTEKKAIALMLAQPSMIKRPVLDVKGKLTVGFKPEEYKKLFG